MSTVELMERGWDVAGKYARHHGLLTGAIVSALRFGKVDDNTFKVLAEAVIDTLDPDSEFDFRTHTELIDMAEKRNIELNA